MALIDRILKWFQIEPDRNVESMPELLSPEVGLQELPESKKEPTQEPDFFVHPPMSCMRLLSVFRALSYNMTNI